jgi:hypothetical protein
MSRLLVVAVALTGCSSPASDSLGEPLWTRPEITANGRVGHAGQLVLDGGETTKLITADGRFGWEVPCSCPEIEIDDEGNVYVLRLGDTATIDRLAAGDGAVEWSLALPTTGATAGVLALDTQGSLWWFLSAEAPYDFGGGALPTPIGGMVFGRYRTTDGGYLASGTLDFSVGEPQRLPDGGFVIDTARDGELVAFDSSGLTRWRGLSSVSSFVTHDDGEITATQVAQVEANEVVHDVVRLDAKGTERWRTRGFGFAETMVALASGHALIAGRHHTVDASQIEDGTFLALYDNQGDARREDFEAEAVSLYSGRAPDGYRMFRVEFVDPSDAGAPGGAVGEIEARRAP